MTLKRRTITLTDTSAHTLGLGAQFGRVVGYDLLSSADTSVSLACVDTDSKTILTEGSADFTTLTTRALSIENAVTEDGTSATGNAGFGGVIAHSPLTLTASGLGSGNLRVRVYVEV